MRKNKKKRQNKKEKAINEESTNSVKAERLDITIRQEKLHGYHY